MTFLQSDRGRDFLRGKAIRGFFGVNGSGKTLTAIWSLLPSLDAGRPVLSTCRLLDFRNPRPCEVVDCDWPGHPEHGHPHPAWIPFTDWRQLIGGDGYPVLRDADVFLDEIAGVASSRASGSLPFQVTRDLQKLRHRRVTLSYTAPAYARTELVIREVTLVIVHCRGSLGVKHSDDEAQTAWRRNRMVRWRAYNGENHDTFKNASVSEAKSSTRPRPMSAKWYWIPGSLAANAYSSEINETLSLGWANDSGMCLDCGGRRSVPSCKCGVPGRHGLALVSAAGDSAGGADLVALDSDGPVSVPDPDVLRL